MTSVNDFSSVGATKVGGRKSGKAQPVPWTSDDAERHTRKAKTPALQALWAKVANEALERTGDEVRAIREANAIVARQVDD
ncbi:hypothetical protein [Caulobacter sp. CCUG 60055]|uniref:hypothetical protein n=1 Tax=Caulobacter sp. CCUG 60055 TaxID=2100090 RepID=UPI001FA7244F|nr:hypothetical protein [Caulobacter sp. CCUG 60055]